MSNKSSPVILDTVVKNLVAISTSSKLINSSTEYGAVRNVKSIFPK